MFLIIPLTNTSNSHFSVLGLILVVVLVNSSVRADLDSENPVKINYDKHGQYLGLELFCGNDEVTPTEGTTTTPEIESTTTTPETSNGCDPCFNEIAGTKVYHQECMRFCICEIGGNVTIRDCEFGLIFNYPTQKCVDPDYSECPYTQWSRSYLNLI